MSLSRRFEVEHRQGRLLLDELERTVELNAPPNAQLTAWREFHGALLSHLEQEERLLLPHLFRKDERTARALMTEHRHLRRRVSLLEQAFEDASPQLVVVRSFGNELRAHESREHVSLYRWCDEHLTPDEKVKIVGAIREHHVRRPAGG
ncbi:MAG: hypothetical protein ABI551_13080 [Polyangiaceae bacterium]